MLVGLSFWHGSPTAVGDSLVGALVGDTVVPSVVTCVGCLTGVGKRFFSVGINQDIWGLGGVDVTAGLLQTIIGTTLSHSAKDLLLGSCLFLHHSAPWYHVAAASSTSGFQLVMPRCRECSYCIEMLEARAKHKGGNKHLQNKLKIIEWKNKCQDPQQTTKK